MPQVVLEKYLDAVVEVRDPVASLEAELRQGLNGCLLRPVVEVLTA